MLTVLNKNIHLDFIGFQLNVFAITSLLTSVSQDLENVPMPYACLGFSHILKELMSTRPWS